MSESKAVSIVLCGQAGQGIQTVEVLLTHLLAKTGFYVYATKEYMSRVRGGANSTEIRVSAEPVRAFARRIDLLVALNDGAIKHLQKRIDDNTVILTDQKFIEDQKLENTIIEVSLAQLAKDVGGKIYANTVAVGAVAHLLGLQTEDVSDHFKSYFESKSEEVIQKNIEAAEKGFSAVENEKDQFEDRFKINASKQDTDQILVNGAQAVGLGAIAGGCNFISAYPMSPSTGVLVFLANQAKDFGIVAEQAEDEIAAINMAVGAWYAGARGMASTSGGGFALMTEGVSLAGMLETPVVVHLAQRPGPATGLPTRTEQADLELALYAGHGEFPRIMFAPGTLDEGFQLTKRAFDLADRFQVPVFILTDQYFMDSYYNTDAFDFKNTAIEQHVVETQPDYRRYDLTENGISPRGIPGFGEGLVCVDSDEHDAEGHITEDLDLRVKMVEKRLKKGESISKEVLEPRLYGPKDYKNLIVCWGSTVHSVLEAVERLDRKDLAVLHFSQVYPLHPKTKEYLQQAQNSIVVEGNATGQFARLIGIHAGIEIEKKILNYSGLMFAADTLAEQIKPHLE